jgi:hypothetical protein
MWSVRECVSENVVMDLYNNFSELYVSGYQSIVL